MWSAIAIIVSVNKISGFLLLLLFYYVMKSSSSTLSVHLTDIECESEPAAAAARLTATRHVPSLYPRHRMMSSSHIRLLLQKHEVYLCCYPAMTAHQLIHRLITITLLHLIKKLKIFCTCSKMILFIQKFRQAYCNS